MNIPYDVAKSYLQWARSIVNVEISCKRPKNAQFRIPPNLIFALGSHAYVYSYMAIVAFANGHLGHLWSENNRYLKDKYSEHDNVSNLFRERLGELKECLKELCVAYKIKKINEAEPELWNDLTQTVKVARDFLVHPKKDKTEFQKIISMISSNNTDFPIKVAEKTIAYFYTNITGNVPSWVTSNQEFLIRRINATLINHKNEDSV